MRKNILLFLSILFFSLSAFTQQNKIDSLLQVLKSEKEDTNRAKTLNRVTYLYINVPPLDYKKALPFAEEAQHLSEKLSYKFGVITAYKYLGTIYGYFGIYEKTLESYLNELKTSEDIGDSTRIMSAYEDISSAYSLEGDYEKELQTDFKIAKMAKSSGDNDYIAKSYWRIGSADAEICKESIKKGDSITANSAYNKAIKNDFMALSVYDRLKDSQNIAFFLIALGSIYDKCNMCEDSKFIVGTHYIKNDYSHQAEQNYLEASEIYQHLNYTERLPDCFSNLALYYRNQGELVDELNKVTAARKYYIKSLKYFLKTLTLIKELGYKHGIANFNKEVGITYLKLDESDKAQEYLLNAAIGFDEIGFKDGAKECYEKLSEVDFKKGDYKNALEDYKKFSALKDSLLNESKTKQLTELDIKYETQKKSDSLVLQQKLISIEGKSIAKQNYFLNGLTILVLITIILFILSRRQSKKISNQYKEIQQLQSELTHRIGNFFSSIKGILSGALVTSSDKETIASIDKKVSTINHLFKTLYSSPYKQHLAFTELLTSICNDFQNSFGNEKNVRVYTKADATISKEEALPLSFIITELLINSYKHAFENTTDCEIHVEVGKEEIKRILHVWDNGKGLLEDSAKKAGSQQGMGIIKSYCKTLQGKMNTWNNNGFHFKMEF